MTNKYKYYLLYFITHIFLSAALYGYLLREETWLVRTCGFLIIISLFGLHIRPDFVLPWYRFHERFITGKENRRIKTRSEYNIIRVLSWIFTVTWFVVLILFATKLNAFILAYIFIIFFFISAVCSDYLFSSYDKYKAMFKNNQWQAFKKL